MSKKPSVQKRQEQEKSILVEQLRKTPIVQIACEKTGTGRTTYYRWRKEDDVFCKAADDALKEGKSLVNDMAESQLLSSIRDGNLTAIIFWLKNQHKDYMLTRMEVTAKLPKSEHLTPEEEQMITLSLLRANLLPSPSDDEHRSRDDQKDAQRPQAADEADKGES